MTDVLIRILDRCRLPAGPFRFLLRAALLALIWKASYELVMRPAGMPDRWLVRQVGAMTAGLLDIAADGRYSSSYGLLPAPEHPGTLVPVATIRQEGHGALLRIYSSCNGLDLMALSAGFILCYPGPLRRKTVFMPLCIVSVFLMNVVRCALLCLVWTGIPHYFEFMHKFLFNLLAYGAVFCLWMAYAGAASGGWLSVTDGRPSSDAPAVP